jgi:hypothetical protein
MLLIVTLTGALLLLSTLINVAHADCNYYGAPCCGHFIKRCRGSSWRCERSYGYCVYAHGGHGHRRMLHTADMYHGYKKASIAKA